jgi:hypothetical protein
MRWEVLGFTGAQKWPEKDESEPAETQSPTASAKQFRKLAKMSMPNGDSFLPVRRRTAEYPPRDCSDRAPALAMQSRWHPDDFDSDPIVEASEHHKAGDRAARTRSR